MKPTFALKDGKPIHVSELDKDKHRGLKCGCVCSACEHPLQARMGKKVRRYFAHHTGSECSIETVIHHTAKQIIMDAGEIHIPATRYDFKNIVNYFVPGKVIPLSNIQDEKWMDNMQPDIVGYYKDKPLLIEIYVTHKVDDIKKKKIKEKGISTIEIDLSDISYDTDMDKLKQLVLYETSNREWINNERINLLVKQYLKNLEYKPVYRCSWKHMAKFFTYQHSDSVSFDDMLSEQYEYRDKVMSFVIDCPLEKHTAEGQSYALFSDCMECKYRYEDDCPDGRVTCVAGIDGSDFHKGNLGDVRQIVKLANQVIN